MTSVQSLTELSGLIQQVRQARSSLDDIERVTKALHIAAKSFSAATDSILEANTLDLEVSLEMAVPERVVEWLKLTPERLNSAIAVLDRFANLDAVSSLAWGAPMPVSAAAHTYFVGEPLGVVALLYEAFPELAIVAGGLCLRTGNSLILKGGQEASQTNQAIAEVWHQTLIEVDLPTYVILPIPPHEGEAARRCLMQTTELDLLIPYGRASLVQQVVRESNSPTLSTAIANCYLYWAHTASADQVAKIVLDSHRGNPEPVNGIEKILVDARVSEVAWNELQHLLQEGHFYPSEAMLPPLTLVSDHDIREFWHQAQLNHAITLARVPDLDTAISFINQYSSGHADCIVTNTYQDSVQFARRVRSASVYVNASPRFRRNVPQTAAIALGMSAQRGIKGGRITLESLLTHKSVIQGIVP
jgi:glutamate-5-semialdehyde dehydrogenase